MQNTNLSPNADNEITLYEDPIRTLVIAEKHDGIETLAAREQASLFLETITRGAPQDLYLIIWAKNSKATRSYKISEMPSALDYILETSEHDDVCFGIGFQPNPPKGGSRGKAKDVVGITGLHLDVDIKGGDHKAENLPENDHDVAKLLSIFPLKPSIRIHSGGGLHLYWLFDQPWLFTDNDERKRAKDLVKDFQKGLIAYAKSYGWTLDYTADLSRVLRVPGTYNHKYDLKKVVIQECDNDQRYSLDEIFQSVEGMKTALPSKWPKVSSRKRTTSKSIKSESSSFPKGNPKADIQKVQESCAWFKHCRDDAKALSEPDWFGMMSILACCKNGEKVAHEWSEPYSGYSKHETRTKFEKAVSEAKPVTCQHIQESLGAGEYCDNCPNNGKVKSPAVLGLPKTGKTNIDLLAFPNTDLGNGERFAAQYGNKVCYCQEFGGWVVWNGTHWELNADSKVRAWAKKLVRKLQNLAVNTDGDVENKAVNKKYFLSLEANSKFKGMLEAAASELTVSPDKFGNHDWLLNLSNGILDLRTKILMPHDSKYMMTYVLDYAYDPSAECPIWDSAVKEICDGDVEKVDYLHRVFGYTLTGSIKEQCLFILYGNGANGKSTVIQIAASMLGSLAKETGFSTFIGSKTDSQIGHYLAELCNVRMVTTAESGMDNYLSEPLIKQVTGGDMISAKRLYQAPFSYKPRFKLFMATNYLPKFKGMDYGLARRLRVIEFDRTFRGRDVDPDLVDKLMGERAGILNRFLDGCIEWQKGGLQEPVSVTSATHKYKSKMDWLDEFMDDCCDVDPGERCSKVELYPRYIQWCGENGEKALSKAAFYESLRKKGFEEGRTAKDRFWVGFKLK